MSSDNADSEPSEDGRSHVVYVLVDPRTGLPRCVGQTGHPEHRLQGHVSDALRGPPETQKAEWIQGLHHKGLEPELRVLARVSARLTETVERRMIEVFYAAVGDALLNQDRDLPASREPGIEVPREASSVVPSVGRPGSSRTRGSLLDLNRGAYGELLEVLKERTEDIQVIEDDEITNPGVSEEEMQEMGANLGLDPEQVSRALRKWRNQGRVYSIRPGRYLTTG